MAVLNLNKINIKTIWGNNRKCVKMKEWAYRMSMITSLVESQVLDDTSNKAASPDIDFLPLIIIIIILIIN